MRSWTSTAKLVLAACLLVLMARMPGAAAADKIMAGTLGGQAPLWPIYIAIHKGIFAADGIDLDLSFSRSGAGVIQELTAGSLEVVVSVGAIEPCEAIDKGAPLALVRFIGKSAPYVLIAKPTIKTLKDLRGKTISVGAMSDIATLYFIRMMHAVGLDKGDYHMISAGVAAARFAALKAGVADAAMVLPPLNFHAADEGYPTVAATADYVKNLPFTGMYVYKPWATTHEALLKRLLSATDKAVAWFEDPAHRKEAVALLVKVAHARPQDAEKSYDFLRRIGYFQPNDKVSRRLVQNVLAAGRELGTVDAKLTVNHVILPGVTDLTP